MSIIKWSEDLSVGIKSIDEQHNNLIEMINQLNAAMAVGEATTIQDEILLKMSQYTRFHFEYEEELFTQHGYPHSESHIKEHKNLVAQVISLRERSQTDISGCVSIEIMQLLENWLINHIKKSDMKYAPYLRDKGVK